MAAAQHQQLQQQQQQQQQYQRQSQAQHRQGYSGSARASSSAAAAAAAGGGGEAPAQPVFRSQYRGVSYDKKKRKWRVQIKVAALGKSGRHGPCFSGVLFCNQTGCVVQTPSQVT
jgi:hypothetical protein